MIRTAAARLVLAGVLVAFAVRPARADVVLTWNDITMATLASHNVNPFEAPRVAATVQLAVFEAVNAVSGRYDSYLGTVGARPGASAEAAAVAAAHAVLVHFYPASAATLNAQRDGSLSLIPGGAAKDDGIALGLEAAAAMIVRRTGDGSTPPQFFLPPSAAPGEWQKTPSCPAAGGILLHWPDVTPFGIESSQQFRSSPPPLRSNAYTRDFKEVREVGAADSTVRPERLTQAARFYNAVLAAAVWNSAARQIAAAQGTSLTFNARAFALLNMAISDGLVSSMETKYHYHFWRPETAIRDAAIDGNPRTEPDDSFVPLITAPCFPSYPSAHASGSYAGRAVVQRLFGRRGHDLTFSTPLLPGVTFHYTDLAAITKDIDNARIYGGIHFRFDQRAGARQGRDVGRFVWQHQLRRRHAARGEK